MSFKQSLVPDSFGDLRHQFVMVSEKWLLVTYSPSKRLIDRSSNKIFC